MLVGFPNEAVIDAYLFPTVNESNEGFSWAPPDLDRIREYMKTKFGWKTARIDEILLPVMKRQTERNVSTLHFHFVSRRPASGLAPIYLFAFLRAPRRGKPLWTRTLKLVLTTPWTRPI